MKLQAYFSLYIKIYKIMNIFQPRLRKERRIKQDNLSVGDISYFEKYIRSPIIQVRKYKQYVLVVRALNKLFNAPSFKSRQIRENSTTILNQINPKLFIKGSKD